MLYYCSHERTTYQIAHKKTYSTTRTGVGFFCSKLLHNASKTNYNLNEFKMSEQPLAEIDFHPFVKATLPYAEYHRLPFHLNLKGGWFKRTMDNPRTLNMTQVIVIADIMNVNVWELTHRFKLGYDTITLDDISDCENYIHANYNKSK